MRRHVAIAAWLCAACVTAAACGRISALARDLAPRSTPPVLKIGLTAPFEGRYRTLGYEALHAVRWAVRQRNTSGGTAGFQIELVALNDDDDPQSAVVQAEKFAVDTQVMGVIGPFSSAAASAASAGYQQSGLAAVTPATCPPTLHASSSGEVFCLGAGVEDLAQSLIAALPTESRVDLLRFSDGYMADALAPATMRVYNAPWTADTLRDMRQDPADLYLYDGDALSAADLALRLRDAGIDSPLWGGPALARAQLISIAGSAAVGTCYALTDPLLADLSADSTFAKGYRGLAGGEPGPWAALAYDAAELMLDALERAIETQGQPTREGVVGELAAARGPDGEPVFVGRGRREAGVTLHCVSGQQP